jgi:hypothetical protein
MIDLASQIQKAPIMVFTSSNSMLAVSTWAWAAYLHFLEEMSTNNSVSVTFGEFLANIRKGIRVGDEIPDDAEKQAVCAFANSSFSLDTTLKPFFSNIQLEKEENDSKKRKTKNTPVSFHKYDILRYLLIE